MSAVTERVKRRRSPFIVFAASTAVGVVLTALAIQYSFWLAHIHPVVLTILAPGLVLVHLIGVTQNAVRWGLFTIFQVIYYTVIGTIVLRLWNSSRARRASRGSAN